MSYEPNREIPEWLNPAVLPPAELRDRLKTLHDRFMIELKPAIDRFVADGRGALREIEQWYGASPSAKYPDDVREVIDELSYHDAIAASIYDLRSIIEQNDDESGF